MSDIVERLRAVYKNPFATDRALLLLAADEIERLTAYRDEAEAETAVARLLVDRLRLTDAEREAVVFMLRHAAYAADIPAFSDSADYRLHHDALRGLLERMK